MSPDEREAWSDRLIAASIDDDEAVAAILDRVEALEAELAIVPKIPRVWAPYAPVSSVAEVYCPGDLCPACGSAYTVRSGTNDLRCFKCGNAWHPESPVKP